MVKMGGQERTKRSTFYDVRAIRLIKTTKATPLSKAISEENCYACLGHFDAMQIEKLSLEQDPILAAIERDGTAIPASAEWVQRDGLNYVYPLYALQQLAAYDEQKELDLFWETDTNYTVVTRLHCDGGEKERKYKECLRDSCNRDAGDCRRISLISDPSHKYVTEAVVSLTQTENARVSLTFYDSLELGDIVGILKSNSIVAALEVQRQLYSCSVVRDAYTYCGIHSALFSKDEQVRASHISWLPSEEIRIAHISTRFSVKAATIADQFFVAAQWDKGHRYFVTGTADVFVDHSLCSELQFLSLIEHMVFVREPNIYDAFCDIITRVGVEYIPPKEHAVPPFKPFEQSFERYPECVQRIITCNHAWRYPLLKLLGTLRAMSVNGVMDDLSKLLSPAVRALLYRINYLLDPEVRWEPTYDKEVWQFLDNWASLSHDISHLEGQLVQHPELHPVRYYIPAMVLQFELKLIRDCSYIISKTSETLASSHVGQEHTYIPMIVPCSQESTSTQCLLDPEGDSNYKGDVPLVVMSPVKLLYRPWTMAHILVHEIAHYAGDNLRNRDKRLDCLIQCCAIHMASHMCINLMETSFSASEKTVLERLACLANSNLTRTTACHIRDLYKERATGDKNDYLCEVQTWLPSAVFLEGISPSFLADCLTQCTPDGIASSVVQNLRLAAQINQFHSGAMYETTWTEHISELIYLSRECYADIIMMLLLKSSFSDYYSSIYESDGSPLASKQISPDVLERYINRMALVALVLDKLSDDPTSEEYVNAPILPGSDDDLRVSQMFIKVNQKIAHYRNAVNSSSGDLRQADLEGLRSFAGVFLLPDEAVHLFSYLFVCARSLITTLAKSKDLADAVAELRGHISFAHPESFSWEDIRHYLEEADSQD